MIKYVLFCVSGLGRVFWFENNLESSSYDFYALMVCTLYHALCKLVIIEILSTDMNLQPPGLVGDQLVAQQQAILQQPSFPIQNHDAGYGSYQLPLQLSQYYNVLPSTKTSWSFPNGCVTSNIVRYDDDILLFDSLFIPAAGSPLSIIAFVGLLVYQHRRTLLGQRYSHVTCRVAQLQ